MAARWWRAAPRVDVGDQGALLKNPEDLTEKQSRKLGCDRPGQRSPLPRLSAQRATADDLPSALRAGQGPARAASRHLRGMVKPRIVAVIGLSSESGGDTWRMSSQTATTRVDPELLVYGSALVLDPQLSADGERILYRVVTADRDADAARSQLMTCSWDGADRRQLTDSGHLDTLARWSPNLSQVAFVSDRAERHAIFVVPADGGEPRMLVRHRSPIAGLAWSPDGTRIAYTCSFDPANPDEAEADKRGPAVRVTRRRDYKMDGVGFIGEARSQIFVVEVASGQDRRLTAGSDDYALPQWSPDGRRLAGM